MNLREAYKYQPQNADNIWMFRLERLQEIEVDPMTRKLLSMPEFQMFYAKSNEEIAHLLNENKVPFIEDVPHDIAAIILTFILTRDSDLIDVIKVLTANDQISQILNSRIPIYAVYSRNPLSANKILALLKPRTSEVTYTPLGQAYFRTAIGKSPPYTYIVHRLASQSNDYLVVPYFKGLKEEEVIKLIAWYPPKSYHRIKDIDLPTESYTGPYGKITEKLKSSLKMLNQACQSSNLITIYYTKKGTDAYLLKEILLGVGQSQFPGVHVMWGKDKKGIIESTVGFNEILNDLKKCGKIRYLVVTTAGIVTEKVIEGKIIGHAMGILIEPKDHQSYELEIFDSGGPTPEVNHIYYWSNQLLEYLIREGYNIKRKLTVDEPFCPQSSSVLARDFQGEGQCVIWAYWYLWLRINNPEIPGLTIRNYMQAMNPNDALLKMKRIATLIM
ncbi:Hypothetical protein POVR1_LOCUS426 [uncultured virus]|nr:Hypothetical protein POVR1_LOCUS426 [uncultured virus]